jgi:hypothetical protein
MGKSFYFNELNNEARERLIDVQQRAEALRESSASLRQRFAGSMAWRARNGHDYLYRRRGAIERSLGPRSEATERAHLAFTTGKAALTETVEGLRRTLAGMTRVNRAMGLGRVPAKVGRILRRLDEAGVLGDQACIVGTNALFAYEAKAGVRFNADLLATGDVDIALDARRNLTLAGRLMPERLLGLLRSVDKTFTASRRGHFSAFSADGLLVDLITPEPRNVMRAQPPRKRRLGAARTDDLLAVEVPRLEMIVDAPRLGVVAVAEDGLPCWIAAADPRWWAAHKLWLGSLADRDPLKRQRDRDQALAVATMLAQAWGEADLSDQALASIPAALRPALREAFVQAAAEPEAPPIW